jgi:hypothetical protein
MRQIGIAVVSAIAAQATAESHGRTLAEAVTHGYDRAFLAGAVISVTCAIIAACALRPWKRGP